MAGVFMLLRRGAGTGEECKETKTLKKKNLVRTEDNARKADVAPVFVWLFRPGSSGLSLRLWVSSLCKHQHLQEELVQSTLPCSTLDFLAQ